MNKLIFMIKFFVIIGMYIISINSWAGCTVNNPVTNTAGGIPTSFSFPNTLSVGTTIGGLIIVPRSTPNSTGIACSGSAIYDVLLNINTNWMLSTSLSTPGVYQTSIPGIGVKVSLVQARKNIPVLTPAPQVWYTEPQSIVTSGAASYTEGINVQFYITGPITPGIYPPEILAETWFNNQYATPSTTGGAKIVTYMLPSITIKAPSCETPNINVNLEKHATTEFSGMYSTSTPKSFNFEIRNCNTDTTSIKYTFKPATGINLQQSGTVNQYITLDSSSTASGVGIQVLYNNGSIVPFNNEVSFTEYTAGAGGSYTIPMKARYIQTAGTISGGTANSAVEFTMSYE
ncbi:fimbrial protein [Phytobacter ursingii]